MHCFFFFFLALPTTKDRLSPFRSRNFLHFFVCVWRRNILENCLLSVKQANRAQVRMCKFDMNATNRKTHDMLVCVWFCARAHACVQTWWLCCSWWCRCCRQTQNVCWDFRGSACPTGSHRPRYSLKQAMIYGAHWNRQWSTALIETGNDLRRSLKQAMIHGAHWNRQWSTALIETGNDLRRSLKQAIIYGAHWNRQWYTALIETGNDLRRPLEQAMIYGTHLNT